MCFNFYHPVSDKPKVTLHARVQSGLSIRKGEEIRLDAFISGSPYPTVTWLKNEEDVRKEPAKKTGVPIVKKKKTKGKVQEPEPEVHCPPLLERLSFDQSKKGETAMLVRDSVRTDHGLFTIQVENTHGIATASCEVNVLGKMLVPTGSFQSP